MAELSYLGQKPITLEGGATRQWIDDGDTVTLYGGAQGDGYKVGFGPCAGELLPANADSRA